MTPPVYIDPWLSWIDGRACQVDGLEQRPGRVGQSVVKVLDILEHLAPRSARSGVSASRVRPG